MNLLFADDLDEDKMYAVYQNSNGNINVRPARARSVLADGG